jgi:uncharacterized cupin superfamily protein
MRARPSWIVSSSEVPEEVGRYQERPQESLSYGRAIGRAAGLVALGIHLERVPSGHRTSWPRAERDDEEFVYVLEGEIDAWADGHLHPMKPGDFAAFPAGTGLCHTFINNSEKDALLLVGGQRTSPQNRIYYPFHPERRRVETWWDDWPERPMGPEEALEHRTG